VSEKIAVALGTTVATSVVGPSLGVLVHLAATVDHSSAAEAAACMHA